MKLDTVTITLTDLPGGGINFEMESALGMPGPASDENCTMAQAFGLRIVEAAAALRPNDSDLPVVEKARVA